MNGYRNLLSGPTTAQQPPEKDWAQRLMQQMPFNPYGPAWGGHEFKDNIFVVPQAPANSLEFDRNAFMPEWLDGDGKLFQPPGPRPLKLR